MGKIPDPQVDYSQRWQAYFIQSDHPACRTTHLKTVPSPGPPRLVEVVISPALTDRHDPFPRKHKDRGPL